MVKRKIEETFEASLPLPQATDPSGQALEAAVAAEDPSTKRLAKRRSLFVRSLPASATTESLIEHFSQSFPVKHATAVTDPKTKQCKGYGFVTFADAEDAQRAQEEFHNSDFGGKKLKIEIAEPRHREIEETVPGVERARSRPVPRAPEAKRPHEKQKEADQSFVPRLIIRNLPWSIKKPEDLSRLFLSYGKIKSVQLPQKKPGLLSGFGFVLLRGKKNAEKAMEGLNGKEIDGRTVAVDWAVDKTTWGKQAPDESQPVEAGTDSDSEESSVVSSDSDDDEPDSDDSQSSLEDDDEANGPSEESGRPEGSKDYPTQDFSTTLFVRNLPWTATDDDLKEHFEQFGPVRYARIVIDHEMDRPKGTGFVCFFKMEDAKDCLRNAPQDTLSQQQSRDGPNGAKGTQAQRSVLQNADADLTGQYSLDGRVLQLSRAVDRNEAARLKEAGVAHREHRDRDKRRLFLLAEGTVPAGTTLHGLLSPSELAMREASYKQRRSMVTSNPSLHLSLTRLAIRNIPRSVTSRDLKDLARKAVVGFAEDVKDGKREKLSKEELYRGGEDMVAAEKVRKQKGKGIVKQAKIVFESADGSKITEQAGAGRSRGYGFIEYYTHRCALMGLRWLNGHAIDYQAQLQKKGKSSQEETEDRKKRLIVEFALENAQVVARRRDREKKGKGPRPTTGDEEGDLVDETDNRRTDKKPNHQKSRASGRDSSGALPKAAAPVLSKEDDKLAKRQMIIARKRALRRDKRQAARKGKS